MLKKKAPNKEKKTFKKSKRVELQIDNKFFENYDIIAYYDGSYSFSKSGYGYCIFNAKTKEELHSYSNFIKYPKSCSCTAEYIALAFLMTHLETHFLNQNILIIGDCRMCSEQMCNRGKIKVKSKYAIFAKFCKQLLEISQNRLTFLWQPRELNEIADSLSKQY